MPQRSLSAWCISEQAERAVKKGVVSIGSDAPPDPRYVEVLPSFITSPDLCTQEWRETQSNLQEAMQKGQRTLQML